MKVSKENIGQICYPIDNSYGIFLDNGQCAAPANMRGQVSSPVKVLTEPFTNTIDGYGGPREREFVLVEYQGREARILNCFFDDLEAAVKRSREQLEQLNDPIFYEF
jgi:hypothetical protein